MDGINKKKAVVDVIVDISIGTHEKIELLLETLLYLDEGMGYNYWIQLGNRRFRGNVLELLVELHVKKKACFSNELPDFAFPQELIDNESAYAIQRNSHYINTGEKYTWFKRNLSLYQAISQYDNFVFLTSDAIIKKNAWLKLLEQKSNFGKIPINGYPLKINIEENEFICGCSTTGWYNSEILRKLPIDGIFKNRILNPWFPYINSEYQKTTEICLSQKFMSAFDTPLNYILFALFWSEIKKIKDPRKWGIENKFENFDLIIPAIQPSDINKESFDPVIVLGRDDDAKDNLRNHYIKSIEKTSIDANDNIHLFPIGGPVEDPILDHRGKKTLGDMHNLYKEKRCFIIGNGPSLNKTDLTKLKNEYTIGLNRIYLNYENMGFQPSFLCVTNPNIIQQFSNDLECLNSTKFLRYQTRDFIKNKWNVFFMEHTNENRFSKNIGEFIWNEGCTVTYCAMQIAYFLGFETVILVGVDHYFPDSGSPHQLITASAEDINHFHPDYFGKGVKWQYPDLKGSEESYMIAKSEYEKDGRIILDATVDGALDIFKKCEYKTLF